MEQHQEERLTYTVSEAAMLLNVSASLLYRELKSGNCGLPFIKIGGRIVIGRKTLEEYVCNFR